MLRQVELKALLVVGALTRGLGGGRARGEGVTGRRSGVFVVLGERSGGEGEGVVEVKIAAPINSGEGGEAAGLGRSDGDAAGGGEPAVAAELGGLFAHFALKGAIDSEKGGVADFEVEDFTFAAGVGG